MTRSHLKTVPEPGTFRPRLPADSQQVVYCYAVAARAICVRPEALEQISHRLEILSSRLVPPELTTATECFHLWRLFARVALMPKASLLSEAGRAFYRDLDALGQRLDLPPLPPWDELPDCIDDPTASNSSDEVEVGQGLSLALVQTEAQKIAQSLPPGTSFPAAEAAKLLSGLDINERRQLFEQMVGKGLLGRSDVNLLIRYLVKSEAISANDTMLVEVLERLGAWLAH